MSLFSFFTCFENDVTVVKVINLDEENLGSLFFDDRRESIVLRAST